MRVQRLDGADVLDVNPEFTQNGTAEPHTDGAAVHGGASKHKDKNQTCNEHDQERKTNMNENMENKSLFTCNKRRNLRNTSSFKVSICDSYVGCQATPPEADAGEKESTAE